MAKHQAAVVESGGPLGKTKRPGDSVEVMECLPVPGQG
jgi:hypothetical protein